MATGVFKRLSDEMAGVKSRGSEDVATPPIATAGQHPYDAKKQEKIRTLRAVREECGTRKFKSNIAGFLVFGRGGGSTMRPTIGRGAGPAGSGRPGNDHAWGNVR